MHDGIELERRGITTAVVVTEPFIATGHAMAALDGAPGYRFAVVGHPTAALDGPELKAAARLAAEQCERILLGTPDAT